MTETHGDSPSRVDYLRLSITDRCNLRCTYCMPPEGVESLSHEQILSYEEMAAFARVAVELGISKVRLTGGEPLVRKGVVGLVASLAAIPGISDLSLTTNGLLLPRFARSLRAAGLRRVNISIDSLRPDRYARITRGGRLADALTGIEAAFAAGFAPVKLNVVLQQGIEEELDDFAALSRERELHVRFIEYMPLDRRHVTGDGFVPAALVLERLRAAHGLEPAEAPYGHGPADYWRVAGARGTLGFIAGVSEHFCGSCNRLRLTADGRLKTCLFSGEETEIRPLLGDPERLKAALREALQAKTYDRRAERIPNRRGMSQIGG
jgi:cyclic pyranopterin phosphate synthase